MTTLGLEAADVISCSSKNLPDSEPASAAQSGAVTTDADLERLAEVWQSLPADVRRAIFNLAGLG